MKNCAIFSYLVLYDNMGHLIIMPGSHESQVREIKPDVKAIKTRNESLPCFISTPSNCGAGVAKWGNACPVGQQVPLSMVCCWLTGRYWLTLCCA